MGKSEGARLPDKVKPMPCVTCGETNYSFVKLADRIQVVCICGRNIDLTLPIHPNRIKAEGLVPAAALEELVKALEEIKLFAANLESGIQMKLVPWDGMTAQSEICHTHADQALAHAREIAKGGK